MLFNYLFVFVIGSIGGYFLELFYRKIKTNKWIKPGVFNGYYLPLYGIGMCICYFAYNLEISFVFKVLISFTLLTFVELMCGLIFVKYYEIPLWDYNNEFLNYKGLICFKFSFIWGILSLVLFLFVFPYLEFIIINNLFCRLFVLLLLSLLMIDIFITLVKLNKSKCKY